METNLRNSFWNPLCPRDDTAQLGSDDGRLRPHKFLISGRHLPLSRAMSTLLVSPDLTLCWFYSSVSDIGNGM